MDSSIISLLSILRAQAVASASVRKLSQEYSPESFVARDALERLPLQRNSTYRNFRYYPSSIRRFQSITVPYSDMPLSIAIINLSDFGIDT